MRGFELVIVLASGSIACGSRSDAPVKAVVVTATVPEVLLGGTLQLVANAFDAFGNEVSAGNPVWRSSNPHVAAVSDLGVLSGLDFGITSVTAAVGDVTGTTRFTVSGIESGSGTAVINGLLSPGEWTRATAADIVVNVPGGATPAKLYVMNDAANLYLALTFARTPPAGERTSLAFEFDDDASGNLSSGDDGFIVGDGFFLDLVRSTAGCPSRGGVCSFADTQLGGTNDGAGVFVNNGVTSVYEVRHPLRSGDTHDFSLTPGSRIGMTLFLRLLQVDGAFQDTDVPDVNAFVLLVIR